MYHDRQIADGVHIGPGARLCGGVKVGYGSLAGVGVVIAPGVSVGRNVRIGAGAAVINDIAEDQTVGCSEPGRSSARRGRGFLQHSLVRLYDVAQALPHGHAIGLQGLLKCVEMALHLLQRHETPRAI